MIKKKFRTFFSYHWYIFLVIFVTVSVGYYYIFEIINTPQYHESVRVFIATKYVDTKRLESKLYQDFADTQIKEVKVDYSDPAAASFPSVFATRGLVNTDVVLVSPAIITDNNYSRHFTPLNEQVLNNYIALDDIEYVVDDQNIKYGIKLNSNMLQFMTYDENGEYAWFFNKKSPKLGQLITNQENDGALICLRNYFAKE